MSDNIIDFNEHRQKKGGEPQGDDFSIEEIMGNLDSMPENGLMNSAAEYVNGHMLKLLSLMDLGKQVTELLTSIGLDPDEFALDEESADRFLALEEFDAVETPFNGPFFDCYTDDDMTRVVTAFQADEDSDTVNLLMAVMRLKDGADRWQRFGEDGWVDDGPPANFFDDLDDWDDEDWDDEDDEDWDDEDDEDWDDDEDDDDPFRQEPWEDEYDDSIYSLYLCPNAYRALSRAGIETIAQLAKMTDLELLAIDGIGSQELEIIHQALEDLDIEAGE